MIEAFAIRNKKTEEYWASTGGKKVFTTIGAAKSAWITSRPWLKKNRKPFNEQDEYEIVRLVPEELSKKDRIYKGALEEITEGLR